MRGYVEANQEIGRMHVEMLPADPGSGPRPELDMEAVTALVERALGGPELPALRRLPGPGGTRSPLGVLTRFPLP